MKVKARKTSQKKQELQRKCSEEKREKRKQPRRAARKREREKSIVICIMQSGEGLFEISDGILSSGKSVAGLQIIRDAI
jgi:hypothetical protein